jgi:hypothetical protein
MNVSAVGSSTVAAIAYDRTRELLQLEFNSHAIYQYFGVPATVHAAPLRAPAQGGDFNQAIGGKFPYSRICNGRAEVPEQDIAAAHPR